MAPTPENACLPQEPESESNTELCPVKPQSADGPDPDGGEQLLQEYTQLRERFVRTTNALASAAHDLKTPLAILNGYIELLQSEKLGGLNDRQREVLRDMHSSGQRLQHFIQDFLSFSVLETGEMKMRYETRFAFDSPKVQRVISNLLENASKFTPAGGTVWLHAEPYMWERRSASNPGISSERRQQNDPLPNSVKVSVSDTGPGIPAEYHIEVFDDFFRLPQTENQLDGMGLGLAIARRLVNGMGGKIWVESDPGAGCKFSFIIPLKPAANASNKGKNK